MRGRTFGETAPKMTAEAAEKWRQSYRRYRHRKHLEKSKSSFIELFQNMILEMRRMNSTEGDGAADPEKQTSADAGTEQTKPRLTTHRERKIHRHIKEIARPRSQDRSAERYSGDDAKNSGQKDEDLV